MLKGKRKKDGFITDHSVELALQWIPRHANIPGNERGDTLAKKGASRPQTDKNLTYGEQNVRLSAELKPGYSGQ